MKDKNLPTSYQAPEVSPPKTSESREQRSVWKNWGDHPVFVTLSALGTLLTILVTIWGMPRLLGGPSDPPVQAKKPEHELVLKSPKEIVDWYVSLPSEEESVRQLKVLYTGKYIRVTGKPRIFAAHNQFVSFELPFFYGSMLTEKIPSGGISDSRLSVIECRIESINRRGIFAEECIVVQ